MNNKFVRLPNGDMIELYEENISNSYCVFKFVNKDFNEIRKFFGTEIIDYVDILDKYKNFMKSYNIYAKVSECIHQNILIDQPKTVVVTEAYTETIPAVVDEKTGDIITEEQVIEHPAVMDTVTKQVSAEMIKVVFEKPKAEDEINNIKKIVGIVNTNSMNLDEYKEYYIKQSNIKLSEYLAEHPLVSTCHGSKEGIYNITKDKQDLMTSNYITYTVKKKNVDPDTVLTWNESGEECEVWEESEFLQLIVEIEAVVKPLVSQQQSIEKQILSATDFNSVKNISLDYSIADIRNTSE